MRVWVQTRLREWLIGPFAARIQQLQDQVETLQHQLASLEQMETRRHPDDPSPLLEEGMDEGRLADLPDAHLGAQ